MQTKEFREPSHQEIAREAYLHWQAGGFSEGDAKLNWFAAETELMQRQAVKEGTLWARETTDLLTA